MKYLILRRRPGAPENPFTEVVAAGGGREFDFPFDVESHDLTDRQAQDVRHDPDVVDTILSMPFTLIKPVAHEATVATSAETAWGIGVVGANSSPQTGDGVTVAVLDTGIDVEHPAFSGLTFGPKNLMDFTTTENGKGVPGSATDVWGHGTHVAGTIFGRDVDGKRIGVAPGVKSVLIGKVLKADGTNTETLYNAIMWALGERADVICMSLSINFPKMVERFIEKGYPADIAASRVLAGFRSNLRLFDDLAQMVYTLVTTGRGALLVAASGNGSRRDEDPRFTVGVAPPATADGFISVGAVSQTGKADSPFAVARFSNTGCLLSAPGVDILSAQLKGGLVTDSGTSMATPHAVGVMALWIEKRFPDGQRPTGWAKDVQRDVENSVIPAPNQSRGDVGLGVVRAPQ